MIPDPLATLVDQFINSLPPNLRNSDSIDQKIKEFIKITHSSLLSTPVQIEDFKQRVIRWLDTQSPNLLNTSFTGSLKRTVSPSPLYFQKDFISSESERQFGKMEEDSSNPQKTNQSPSPFIRPPSSFTGAAASHIQTPLKAAGEEREELTPERIKGFTLQEMQKLAPKEIKNLTKEAAEELMKKYKEMRTSGGTSPLTESTLKALGDLKEDLRKNKSSQTSVGEQTTPARSTPSRGTPSLEKLEATYKAACFFAALPEKVREALQLYGINPENFSVQGDLLFIASPQSLKTKPPTKADIDRIKNLDENKRKKEVQDYISAGWVQLAYLLEQAIAHIDPLIAFDRQIKQKLEEFNQYIKENSKLCNLVTKEKGQHLLQELEEFSTTASNFAESMRATIDEIQEARDEARKASTSKKMEGPEGVERKVEF